MWLAVLMVCSTPEVLSCIVVGNTEQLWPTEEQCKADVLSVGAKFMMEGYFVRPNCFKIGESA